MAVVVFIRGGGVGVGRGLGKVCVGVCARSVQGVPLSRGLVYYNCSCYRNKLLFLYQTQCLYTRTVYKEIIYTQVLNIHIDIKFLLSIINNYHITIAVICDCIPEAFDATNNDIDLNNTL